MKKFVFVFLAFFATQAHADNVSDLVEALKGTHEKYEVIGTICEQATRLDLQREYPAPRYTVETGISYGRGGRTVGELDVTVFDSGKDAVLIAEVKCWKNLSGGAKKARDQRNRFLTNMRNSQGIKFWDAHHSHSSSQFEHTENFITVAQKGGVGSGYDRELSYTLEELMEARRLLLKK